MRALSLIRLGIMAIGPATPYVVAALCIVFAAGFVAGAWLW